MGLESFKLLLFCRLITLVESLSLFLSLSFFLFVSRLDKTIWPNLCQEDYIDRFTIYFCLDDTIAADPTQAKKEAKMIPGIEDSDKDISAKTVITQHLKSSDPKATINEKKPLCRFFRNGKCRIKLLIEIRKFKSSMLDLGSWLLASLAAYSSTFVYI